MRAVAALSDRFVGRNVYAYGGATLRCGPYVAAFAAGAPLVIRSVERERGRAAMVWAGAVSAGNDLAPHFLTIEPLRFVFATLSSRWLAYGGSIEGAGCSAIELADWQVDRTLSMTAPPPGLWEVA